MNKNCPQKGKNAKNPNYICNPKTGKWVKKDGPTGKKILSLIQSRPKNPRGSRGISIPIVDSTTISPVTPKNYDYAHVRMPKNEKTILRLNLEEGHQTDLNDIMDNIKNQTPKYIVVDYQSSSKTDTTNTYLTIFNELPDVIQVINNATSDIDNQEVTLKQKFNFDEKDNVLSLFLIEKEYDGLFYRWMYVYNLKNGDYETIMNNLGDISL